MNKTHQVNILTISTLITIILHGCATTNPNPDDPWENWNRSSQKFNDDVDEILLQPMATSYLFSTPEVIDTGVTNFFSNIDDISVTINDFLQFKPMDGSKSLGRFLVNSTAGVAGFMDIATTIDLPKQNEDFEQTLGVWGVPSGSYLVLPFWGPSSPRGVAGLLGDALLDPLNYTVFAGFAVSTASTVADIIDVADQRAGLMTSEKLVNEASIDRYDFIKSSYIQHRNYLIYDGNLPEDESFFVLDLYEEESLGMND